MRPGFRSVAVAALTTAVAASAPAPRASAAADGDWTTYHHDNARSGVAAGLAPLGALSRAWTATLDGAVYGQPLAVGDRIFAATENDTVYALDASTGAVVWSTHVGTPVPRSSLPCGNINPLGITSTMVYDPATGLLFALAERTGPEHVLVSIDAATGHVSQERAAEPPRGDVIAHQQRAALNLLGDRSTSPTAAWPVTAQTTSGRSSPYPPPAPPPRIPTPCRPPGRPASGRPAAPPSSATTFCTPSATAKAPRAPTTAVTRSWP